MHVLDIRHYGCLFAIPQRLLPVSVSLPSSVVSGIVKSCVVLECTLYMYSTVYHCTVYKLALILKYLSLSVLYSYFHLKASFKYFRPGDDIVPPNPVRFLAANIKLATMCCYLFTPTPPFLQFSVDLADMLKEIGYAATAS